MQILVEIKDSYLERLDINAVMTLVRKHRVRQASSENVQILAAVSNDSILRIAEGDPGILVREGMNIAGRGPGQATSETYILTSFFLQIPLLLDTLNLDV